MCLVDGWISKSECTVSAALLRLPMIHVMDGALWAFVCWLRRPGGLFPSLYGAVDLSDLSLVSLLRMMHAIGHDSCAVYVGVQMSALV